MDNPDDNLALANSGCEEINCSTIVVSLASMAFINSAVASIVIACWRDEYK
ncbi:hypothetical protein D3C86_2024730 [compost metagenome]